MEDAPHTRNSNFIISPIEYVFLELLPIPRITYMPRRRHVEGIRHLNAFPASLTLNRDRTFVDSTTFLTTLYPLPPL